MGRARAALPAGLALGGLLLSLPCTAAATVLVDAEPARHYNLPVGFEVGRFAVIDGGDGARLLVQTLGEDEQQRCVVVHVAPDGVRALRFPRDGRPTQCVGASPRDDDQGGFFVRGVEVAPEGERDMGFTAWVDPTGQRRWQLSDRALVRAAPGSAGGPGAFRGSYLRPHPVMAYSAESGELLLFSVGALDIQGDERPLNQAHVLEADTGKLLLNGQLFGETATHEVNAARAWQEGDFLMIFQRLSGLGAVFYRFDGGQQVSRFEPAERSWDDRIVQQIVFGPDGRLYLLWGEGRDDLQTKISAVAPRARRCGRRSTRPTRSCWRRGWSWGGRPRCG